MPLAFAMLTPAVVPPAGLRIKTHYSSPFRGDTVTYIQNDRKRVEERGQSAQPLRRRSGSSYVYVAAPLIVTITRCDLNEIYVLNLDAHEYMSVPIHTPPSKEDLEARAADRAKQIAQSPAAVLIETTTSDTGERKQIFGYSARHVVTTVKQLPTGDSGTLPQETVTDGWYIDLDTTVPCARGSGLLAVALVGSAPRNPGEPYRLPVWLLKASANRKRALPSPQNSSIT